MTDDLALSVILPVHDEAENLPILWKEVAEVLPALLERFTEEIPVTFVDGRQHDFWRVDEQRLRAALA